MDGGEIRGEAVRNAQMQNLLGNDYVVHRTEQELPDVDARCVHVAAAATLNASVASDEPRENRGARANIDTRGCHELHAPRRHLRRGVNRVQAVTILACSCCAVQPFGHAPLRSSSASTSKRAYGSIHNYIRHPLRLANRGNYTGTPEHCMQTAARSAGWRQDRRPSGTSSPASRLSGTDVCRLAGYQDGGPQLTMEQQVLRQSQRTEGRTPAVGTEVLVKS
jgi:hypothetical protein